GSLVTSFVLVPWIGSSHSEQVIIIVSAVAALIMLEPSYAGVSAKSTTVTGAPAEKTGWSLAGTIVLAIAMMAAGLLARSVHALPGMLVAYGRYAATRIADTSISVLYVGEGLNA